MRVLIVVGAEEEIAWSVIPEQCSRRNIAVFSPLGVCKYMLEESLCVDPDQGDVRNLVRRMRQVINEETSGCFAQLLLMALAAVKEANSMLMQLPNRNPSVKIVENMLVAYDDITPDLIKQLKTGTVHYVRSMGFGPKDRAAVTVDDLKQETVPETDELRSLIFNWFGKYETLELVDSA